VQHRFNRSPGQRYRCEQYISYLQDAGFECTYSPVIANQREDDALYRSVNLRDKILIFFKSFIRRINDVIRAGRYDIVFIYREAFPTGWVFFEKLLKMRGAKIILDFDDAIWLPTVSEVNKSLQWLKNPAKVNEIIALSDLTITGNSYLANYARQFNKNVIVFPSTINLNYYRLNEKKQRDPRNKKLVIGWSGSHTTIEHFETIIPVLQKLQKTYGDKIEFAVYGDPHYRNDLLNIKGTAWSPETEVDVISSFDIGIMPLPDNQWTQGKCAMKGLLYMGLGVPAVLASVGMNKDVIRDGENGFLAQTDDDWLAKLSELINNEQLRARIGKEGRKTIEENFSCQVKHTEYVNIFLALSAK
jgi:glycosyltransferase involved in cell wall biosynthesis